MALVYSPADALTFRRPFKAATQDVLRLTNKNNSPVAFKVKTTAPKQYCVRPNAGRIESGDTVEIQIVLQPMKEDPPLDYKCRDKFLIQSIQVTPEMETMPMSELWSMVEREAKSSISEKKLRVKYLAPPPTEDSATADAATALGADTPAAHQPRAVHQQSSSSSSTARALPGPSPLAKSIDQNTLSDDEQQVPSPTESGPSPPPSDYVQGQSDDQQKTTPAEPQRLFEESAPHTPDTPSKSPAAVAQEPSRVQTAKRAELDSAMETIEKLKERIAMIEKMKTTGNAAKQQQEQQPVRSASAAVQKKTIDGFTVQSVAIVALVSFLVGYFFF